MATLGGQNILSLESHGWWPRLWSRPRSASNLPGLVREAAGHLAPLSDAQLKDQANSLRGRVAEQGTDQKAVQIDAFALMVEAVRREHQIQLYDVQLQAASVLANGGVAEMQTGEGKTLACTPAALLYGLTGRGVHIATPNAYLADRDCQLLAPAFRLLGVSVGLLPEQVPADQKRAAYRCDITYATGYELGFDYLRDQLTCKQTYDRPLGQALLARIQNAQDGNPPIQRSRHFAVVDEIDNVLLDDAGSPLVLSGSDEMEASDAAAHALAAERVCDLVVDKDYHFDRSTGHLALTDGGRERIHQDDWNVPIASLLRTWSEYIEKALLAHLHYQRDIHYVVADGAVKIVDPSTGRIFSDRTWRDGLHQAIEAKEGLRITAEKTSLAQITRQRFFQLYTRLSGMTGTATGCEREFHQVCGLKVHPIPLRVPSQRQILPTRFFADADSKRAAITASALELQAQGRPVLVGTRSITDSQQLADLFHQRKLEFQLLNGRQDAEEADIISRAGRKGAITIATNLAGRGTDICLTPAAAAAGGLHVIVAECHDSSRVDRQLIGRGARQGDPGSAQQFVSADDSLVQRLGPWLARLMQQHAGPQREVAMDLKGQLQRLQAIAERQDYAARSALLRRDRARDRLLGPDDCQE